MCRPPVKQKLTVDVRCGYGLYKRVQQGPKVVRYALEAASLVADEALAFPISVIALVMLLFLKMEVVPFAAEIFGDLGLLTFVETSIKAFVGRTRPPYARQSVFYILPGEQFSFPSGHTMRAFYFATSLAVSPLWQLYLGRTPPALGVAIATGTALSRIAKGKHWPSDVVGGAVVGIGLAILAASLGPRNWALAKLPCGVILSLEALIFLVVPKWRTPGFPIHFIIALLWCTSVPLGFGFFSA